MSNMKIPLHKRMNEISQITNLGNYHNKALIAAAIKKGNGQANAEQKEEQTYTEQALSVDKRVNDRFIQRKDYLHNGDYTYRFLVPQHGIDTLDLWNCIKRCKMHKYFQSQKVYCVGNHEVILRFQYSDEETPSKKAKKIIALLNGVFGERYIYHISYLKRGCIRILLEYPQHRDTSGKALEGVPWMDLPQNEERRKELHENDKIVVLSPATSTSSFLSPDEIVSIFQTIIEYSQPNFKK